ncbi:MAG: ABC transporter ATP-binding protein [Verrucomicrobiae bacterium]|nr:ABC transporter ATP-binding protein [Verrucomicrobiae bacterium]
MALLELQGLRKSFSTPTGEVRRVVDIPELSVDSGEQVGVFGPSGSGKTTLLHLIAGILRPDAGRILLQGRDLTPLREPQLDRVRAESIGLIFQSFNLLQGFTALENVALGMAFGRGVDWQRARHLLGRVGLAAYADYRPGQLSTGQQQRVAVARALAPKPALVLADEPTASLDEAHAQAALKLIRELCQEESAALMLVSHDPAVLRSFPRRLEMSLPAPAVGEGGT